VGSYGRNTAIDGFSDLDMVFELPSDLYFKYDEYTGNGQSALLQAVRNSIQKTYSTSSLGADGQVVVISFTDGITFEVVPVFNNKAGSYTYPDSNDGGKWRTTNPRPEIEAIRSRNTVCNGNLMPEISFVSWLTRIRTRNIGKHPEVVSMYTERVFFSGKQRVATTSRLKQ
jgi:hypothetical protein